MREDGERRKGKRGLVGKSRGMRRSNIYERKI